jgi:hypothetical protein
MSYSFRVAARFGRPGKSAQSRPLTKQCFRLTEGLSSGRLLTVRSKQFSRPRPVCRPATGGLLLFWGYEISRQLMLRRGRITTPSPILNGQAIRVEHIVQPRRRTRVFTRASRPATAIDRDNRQGNHLSEPKRCSRQTRPPHYNVRLGRRRRRRSMCLGRAPCSP